MILKNQKKGAEKFQNKQVKVEEIKLQKQKMKREKYYSDRFLLYFLMFLNKYSDFDNVAN